MRSSGSSSGSPATTSPSSRADSATCRAQARRFEFAGDDALPAEPRIPGPHNRENAAAATAAARAAGIADDAIARRARRPSRACRIGSSSCASSAACATSTTPRRRTSAAALRALASFPGAPLHVILGGRGKHEPYEPLAAAFDESDRAYLIGEAAEEIAPALVAAGVELVRAGDLATALREAAAAAAAGDVVLLSPACASFDQFRDFEARGDAFRELVEALP